MRRTLVLFPIVLILVLTSLGTSVGAPPAAQPPDVLNALLVEVRGLRAAMEQLAAAGPRVQLSMGRLQLQEQRINTLVRRLDEVRDRRAAAETEVSNAQREISGLEAAIRRDPSNPEAQQLERQVKALRFEVAEPAARLNRLQNEEIALGQEIAAEQGRWAEINQRLEELDRALSRR